MNERHAYLDRVQQLLSSLSRHLTEAEVKEVQHLIDHGEPAEGMRSLAWIIVEGRKRVPREAIITLKELASDLIEKRHMPTGLDDCVQD